MSKPKTIQQVAQGIQEHRSRNVKVYDYNWRKNLPEGSRWFPGAIGKPACPICKGIGYYRIDLPIGHPDFGKLIQCECL